ncbi:hypothetical protein [Lactobacillus taiwanensis]|uniref:hypothetical protein n=1 Tax=Lactobacillus taiwanensis TaxID=508451 RepID=UPI001AEC5AEE|nr:hypothetical protein [Lactobacillus taiwanensis]QTQ40807.1 hypothetical protein H1A07_09665 [Lactobacillus taiwanensis]
MGNIPSEFGKALKGEYGQKWVTTTKFEANKSPKELQKILKNNDGENYFATDDIRVWHRGKEYSGIHIKGKEGHNDKVVFSYTLRESRYNSFGYATDPENGDFIYCFDLKTQELVSNIMEVSDLKL